MKKTLFTLVAVVTMVMSTSGQEINDTSTNDTATEETYYVERIVDKYADKLEYSITSLAKGLKQPAEHVYKILVKQQIVNSIVIAMVLILGLVMLYLFSKTLSKAGWKDTERYYKDDWKDYETYKDFIDNDTYNKFATLSIIYGTISFILLFYVVLHINQMITGFINPEYGAINHIINLIK